MLVPTHNSWTDLPSERFRSGPPNLTEKVRYNNRYVYGLCKVSQAFKLLL